MCLFFLLLHKAHADPDNEHTSFVNDLSFFYEKGGYGYVLTPTCVLLNAFDKLAEFLIPKDLKLNGCFSESAYPYPRVSNEAIRGVDNTLLIYEMDCSKHRFSFGPLNLLNNLVEYRVLY